MTFSAQTQGAISATLKISGGPPLPGGFTLADALLSRPLALSPGHWLSAPHPVALFDQSAPERLRLIVAPGCPERLALTLHGQARSTPAGAALLISRGLSGLGGLLFAARRWRDEDIPLLAVIEPPQPPPFQPTPARIWLPEAPPEAIATLPLLEDWGIPNRLASPDGLPGYFEGDALALADQLTYHSHTPYEKVLFIDE